MARPVRFQRAKLCRVRPISQLESDRTHKPPNAREEELGIAHTKLDLKWRNSEIAKIRRMAKVPEYENGTKCHEEHPDQRVRMRRDPREDRNPRRG